MKVLKDPDQVLQIMNRKLDELRKKFDEAEDELEWRHEVATMMTACALIEGHMTEEES